MAARKLPDDSAWVWSYLRKKLNRPRLTMTEAVTLAQTLESEDYAAMKAAWRSYQHQQRVREDEPMGSSEPKPGKLWTDLVSKYGLNFSLVRSAAEAYGFENERCKEWLSDVFSNVKEPVKKPRKRAAKK
ncbi:hypothetical protein [Parahaliea mediterranea]|uniref:hypothetical protein n=1 Tax=Parahaliea mediterranea TaxID=651086 RepID=UPI000E2ECBEF|nr:hypothetical protein [Parahaliea mediterranea]